MKCTLVNNAATGIKVAKHNDHIYKEKADAYGELTPTTFKHICYGIAIAGAVTGAIVLGVTNPLIACVASVGATAAFVGLRVLLKSGE